jgi:hypothetical protein
MSVVETRRIGESGLLNRALPLTGVAFALLSMAGNLIIGNFPDGKTPAAQLRAYYVGHHSHVSAGATLRSLAIVFFALFGVALWSRVRRAALPACVGALILVGMAVDAAAQLFSAGVYQVLGSLGANSNINNGALQAWHIAGSEFGNGSGITVAMIGVGIAGLVGRAIPRWLALTGLIIGVAQLTPVSFLASLVFLAWCAVTSIVLTTRTQTERPDV